MLESISISNFTIIDQASIDFHQGMTALTGETGAGKSILLDAIKLVLGDRADTDCIKQGCNRADISVSFDISDNHQALTWLNENQFDQQQECLIRRIVQATGRSKAFINGIPATLGQLRQFGEMLVDLHGQHEHQSLQKPRVQALLLDSWLENPLLLETVKQRHASFQAIHQRLQAARDQSTEKQQRIDLLNLYCDELSQLDLDPANIDELINESRRLAHAEQILQICGQVLGSLYENESFNIQQQLSFCQQQLEELGELDHSTSDCGQMIDSALIQVQEAASSLMSYRDGIELDPARLDWVNLQISQLQSLARKHQLPVGELQHHANQLQQELQQLTADENNLEQLEKQTDEALEAYFTCAETLSKARRLRPPWSTDVVAVPGWLIP